MIHSFRKTYRNPIMRALGLNFERKSVRVLIYCGWATLAVFVGFAISVGIGYALYRINGTLLDGVALGLIGIVPVVALTIVYIVDEQIQPAN